jgi:hypothetical protein
MKLKHISMAGGLAVAAIACLSTSSWAIIVQPTTYNYTISNGNYTIGNQFFNFDPSFSGSITTNSSDSVTAADVVLSGWTGDGGHTLTFTNIDTAFSGQQGFGNSAEYLLVLDDTVGSGIHQHTFYLDLYIPNAQSSQPLFHGTSTTIDSGNSYMVEDSAFNEVAYDFGGNLSVTSTPLPGALPLIAGGLGMLGMIGARRRRKVVAA